MPKVAITGAGYAARYYVKALSDLGYSIVGITNRTKERGMQLAKEAKTQFYDNYEDLLRASDIDMICIATATTNHLSEIQTAVHNGISRIFCEKPAGADAAETREIAVICEEHKTVVGIGYKMRYESIFNQVKELVEYGCIGELASLIINYYQPIPHSSWYLDNGVIKEIMSHTIDLSNWLAGSKPKWVSCNTENHIGGLKEDRAFMVIKYESGVTASINGGWISDYPHLAGRQNICFQLVGTGGYIFGVRPNRLVICNGAGSQEREIVLIDPIKLELMDFVDKAMNGHLPSIGISDAILVQDVIDAALRSANSGGIATNCLT